MNANIIITLQKPFFYSKNLKLKPHFGNWWSNNYNNLYLQAYKKTKIVGSALWINYLSINTVNSLVSGHPRELKKVSISRAVHLHVRELFP